MSFKIRYKFKEDKIFYSCVVTYDQFQNLKKLPSIAECEIIKKDQKNLKDYKDEMQKAINFVAKNNTAHIRKLSEIVK